MFILFEICLLPLCLLTAVLFLFYRYATRNFGFWAANGIPTDNYVPVFGTMSFTWKKATHLVLQDAYNRLGPIYGGYEGSTPVLYIGNPDLIKDFLIKDFNSFSDRRIFPKTGDPTFDNLLIFMRGEDSKNIRSVMAPTFSGMKMRQMFPLIQECCETLTDNLLDIMELTDGRIDAKEIFGAFTTDVIACCAFGTSIDSYRDPKNPFVVNSKKIFGGNVGLIIVLSLFAPWIVSLLRLDVLPKGPMTFFKNIIESMIKERRRAPKLKTDFLDLILEAEDKEDGVSKKVFSTDMILSQCVLFFLAGFETTASSLAYVAYCLAVNPHSQNKLINEIDNAVAKHKGVLSVDVISKLPYLEAVVSESLRLYPAFSYLLRTCSSPCIVGGIPFRPGMMVNIPIYAIHRDPNYFAVPEEFIPERFLPENKDSIVPYSYLPFGTGPRNCLGMRFALLEIKAALAYTLQHVRFVATEETKKPLKMFAGRSFLTAQEVPVAIEKRDDL